MKPDKPFHFSKTLTIASLLLAAAPPAYYLYIREILPDIVPIHYNSAGIANDFTPKDSTELWLFLLSGYLVFLFMRSLNLIILFFTNRNGENKAMPRFLSHIEFPIVALFVVICLFFLRNIPLSPSKMDTWFFYRITCLAISLGMFIPMGNLLPKLKRNKWAGIRSTYALSGDAEWRAVQIFGGRLFVYGGAVMSLISLIPPIPNKEAVIVNCALFFLICTLSLLWKPSITKAR